MKADEARKLAEHITTYLQQQGRGNALVMVDTESFGTVAATLTAQADEIDKLQKRWTALKEWTLNERCSNDVARITFAYDVTGKMAELEKEKAE